MAVCLEKELSPTVNNSTSLKCLDPGSSALVISVPDHPLLYALGLRPGKIVQCRGCQLFGGPLMIKTGERQVALSKKLAENIMVNVI